MDHHRDIVNEPKEKKDEVKYPVESKKYDAYQDDECEGDDEIEVSKAPTYHKDSSNEEEIEYTSEKKRWIIYIELFRLSSSSL